jgi:tetratricopeptide (TPR) repeat protein
MGMARHSLDSRVRLRHASLLEQAESDLASNRVQMAEKKAQRILCADPDHVGALEISAKCQWRLGRFEPVVATTERLIRLNPYEPGYHSLRGAALQALGLLREAIRHFRRSIELGEDANSVNSVIFLEECQRSLVDEMLQNDEAFRDAFRRDPVAACLSKGIHLPVQALRADVGPLTVRPS